MSRTTYDNKALAHISINKLSEKNKKTFGTRTIYSIVFCAFYVFSVVNSILSDTKFGWFPVENHTADITRQVFSYLQIAWMSIISVLAVKEITNLHFYKNIMMYCLVLISLLICTIVPSIIFIAQKFDYFNITDGRYFYIFMITWISCYAFAIITNIIGFWMQGLWEVKKIFVHLVLILLVSMYIMSWIYFSFFKGWITLLILFLIVCLTDAMAYICGMLFGKRKLSSYISPNKTLGGVIGGISCATLIVMLIFVAFSFIPEHFNVLGNFFGIKYQYKVDNLLPTDNSSYSNAPWWWISVLIIVITLSVVAVVGDLSYSYIKRVYSIKDFSHLLPGHGGVLDRIDSHTFVVTVFFIFTIMISYFSSTAGLF